MKGAKLWSVGVLAAILCGLGLSTAIVVVVDPFFQYHKPTEGLAYHINNQSYQNPGIVKNFDYDTVISGSSMTENFKASWFQDIMGLNAVKVPYGGGFSKNMNIILKMALQETPNLKKIIWGLDIHALEAPLNKTRHPLPYYLYDKSLLNDVSYLLNKEVLCNNVKQTILDTRAGKVTTNFDQAYFWEQNYTFRESVVLNGYTRPQMASEQQPTDIFLQAAKENLEGNILPLIRAYPETEFDIFFPPYSVLFWDVRVQNGNLDATIRELDYVIASLLEYENVRLFYFQNIEEIVTNLYRYKDYTHYNSDVNYYMVECFENEKHRLTNENYQTELEKMRELALNFNYNLYWETDIPLRKETCLRNYLELADDSKYLVFISAKDDMSAGLTEQTQAGMRKLGLQEDLLGKYRWSYLVALDGGEVFYEELAEAPLEYHGQIANLGVEMRSQGMDTGNLSSIKIDGIEYSVNSRGLNIVVYDKILKRVVDSVCFDTHIGLLTASR